MPVNAAKAPWIMQSQFATTGKPPGDVIMLTVSRTHGHDPQVSRHTQMDDQAASLQLEDQVFCAAGNSLDALSGNPVRQVDGPSEVRISDNDLVDSRTFHQRCNAAAGGFNFRQFRHAIEDAREEPT